MATKINYAQIRAEADLYKYSIVPSISSWNLTVALKNYLWQDPSITTPVKVQIWDTVRTITSALSFSENAWSNHRNCWSSELATKEVDFFVYLAYDTTNSVVKMQMARFWSWRIMSDFAVSWLDEKGINLNLTSTDNFVNIGRFSAILSAGAWYTWSTPSAWFQVINSPIFNTKRLEWVPSITWTAWTAPSWSPWTNVSSYYIIWNKVFINLEKRTYTAWSTVTKATFSLPFNATINTHTLFNWYIGVWWDTPNLCVSRFNWDGANLWTINCTSVSADNLIAEWNFNI